MHGSGNDYVFVDGFDSDIPEHPQTLAARVADRHFGIGSDGLILLRPTSAAGADVEMEMWNADGSAGAICGNGLRCVALWMAIKERSPSICVVETESGGPMSTSITPDFDPRSI